MQKLQSVTAIVIAALFFLCAAFAEELPQWEGYGITELNGNVPEIDESLYPEEPGVIFTMLDELGRPGPAYARLHKSIFPTAPRSPLYGFTPAGYQNTMYDFIPGGYLYNRSHLIGNLFCGIDELENLFTGTQLINHESMYQIEQSLYFYLDLTGNTVLYSVRPAYIGDNLVPSGVYLDAYSIEDNGIGFSRCCYLHNVQPGVMINYADGTSCLAPVTQ